MPSFFRIAAAIIATALSLPALATVTPYTNLAAFNAALTAGSYTETFTGLSDTPSPSYSDGQFGFDITATGGLFSFGNEITTGFPDTTITIAFTGAPVRGVGGNFFLTDIDGSFYNDHSLHIALSTGEDFLWNPSSASAFVGFVSDLAFSSISITPFNVIEQRDGNTGHWATVDNLTVGNVPEPTSMVLVGLALASLAALRRRRN